MNDTFGSVDRGVLLSMERAVGTGRRITARHARKQKRERARQLRRVRHASRTWITGAAVGLTVVAIGAGGAIALGGGSGDAGPARSARDTRRDAATPTTKVPGLAAGGAAGLYIQFTDAAGTTQYMYCTKLAGCGLVDVASDGSTAVAVTQVGGVWHREVRSVLRHDPCVTTGGGPGDLVEIVTTDLRPEGTQRIKGVKVPARITGTVARKFETPDQPNCTFESFTGGTQTVDAPVTELTPAGASGE